MKPLWPGKGMVSLRELSDFTGRSAKVLMGMITRGEMQAVRLGRAWVVPRAEAFRILGLQDPEGTAPEPITMPVRPRLAPRDEAVIQRFLGR